ncbi:MAG: beta-ketoacyl synthase chain length factor [Marinilabiliaceae bacterium]|nr:beta-ketoacyl synthase chain length factor [Marinilabiliaceae bacterium]
MGIFIHAYNAISPAFPFEISDEMITIPQSVEGALYCQEPVYKQFITPKLLRRMSRAVKMGVACALENLKQTQTEQPDAILIATGLGCVADTVKFLDQMTENKETLLNPTPFIQSTHNTVSGQIALLLQCKSYNLTFTQNQFSFETALLEGMMLLEENQQQIILVGGVDELTAESHQLMKSAGCATDGTSGKGYVPGEGAAFFTLSGEQTQEDQIELVDLRIVPALDQDMDITVVIDELLQSHQLHLSDIDLLLTGENDERSAKKYYGGVFNEKFDELSRISFKNYCGEYDTASAYALWHACTIMSSSDEMSDDANYTLIINHYKVGGYALFLLKR